MSSSTQKTPIWQFKAFQNWVKTILISELVEVDGNVAELFCGSGLDLGKWERARIGRYIGIDTIQSSLKEAEASWQQRKCTYDAQFLNIDTLNTNLNEQLPTDMQFDVVSCFDGMQRAFSDMEQANTFIKNASSRLKNGGYFFGILPDSSAIWYKSQKVTSGLPCIKSTLFNIDFGSDTFSFFGSTYNMSMKDGSSITESLVHFPTFISLCKQHGLLFIEASNLSEFYEDNKKNYDAKLKQSGVLVGKGKIEPAQMELISLYTTFIFYKETELPKIIQS
ncbi:hypothetical protein SAMD00019534_000460 [Acytostelium subglobosum LB1]|uniref:hypothetical protein n=1 Tax=Acytostelium subglobosum LB1 TaxID=1410327 RepID=UPI0006449BFC|nr:hypothetical protein SAMD00019534_000460 [Acytostelium subglobosum LB1]GAM16871.1 hypothetical protein SAMD00019534_000460 [Acytostelium subglobosum LB1]|eukprot:XP_012758933.1 hypothetical protein SAMD00019534_000460 [Acytostelium subglobosum LB1]